MTDISFEDLQGRYGSNDIVRCLTTGKQIQIRGVKCLVGVGENQRGYAWGQDHSEVIIYQEGKFAKVLDKGVDTHAIHIQNVLGTCNSLGIKPSDLLKRDYMNYMNLLNNP